MRTDPFPCLFDLVTTAWFRWGGTPFLHLFALPLLTSSLRHPLAHACPSPLPRVVADVGDVGR
jgi:hypothetical protein